MDVTRSVISTHALVTNEEHTSDQYAIEVLWRCGADKHLCGVQCLLMLQLSESSMPAFFVTVVRKCRDLMQSAESKHGVLDCGLEMASLQDDAIPESRVGQAVGALDCLLPKELEVSLFQQVRERWISDESRYQTVTCWRCGSANA